MRAIFRTVSSLYSCGKYLTTRKFTSLKIADFNAVRMTDQVLPPRDAGKYIADNSKDVSIDDAGVKKTAQLIYEGLKKADPVVDVKRWKLHTLNPSEMNEAAVDWVFVSDLLNFSFWSDAPEKNSREKFLVNYKGEDWTGYWAWCACLNRALDEGVRLTDPRFYQSVSREELARVLRSDTDHQMPLFDERLEALHQAGQRLCEKFDGSFVNVVKAAEGSAQTLIRLVVDNFPSFDDKAEFNGKKVALYKRVQILVADIWACFEGQGYGAFHDIDSVTMFADYRIPQALAWFGALRYSDQLTQLLNDKTMMLSGDRMEVEIRGCTIWAVELVVEEVRRLLTDTPIPGATINAILVDHYLWDYRRDHAAETDHIPIHRVRCVYY